MVRFLAGLLAVLTLMVLYSAPAEARSRHHRFHGHGSHAGLVSVGERTLGARAHHLGLRPRNWCADWMNLTLRRAGIRGTGDSRAISFRRWGRASGPHVGAIAVMPHHVGIVAGTASNGRLLILSGNHSRRVAFGTYSRSRIIAYRMPG